MKIGAIGVIVASLALGPAAVYGKVTKTQTPVGKFQIVEEVSKLEPGDVPIMHVNQNWSKLHLVLVTADQKMKVEIVDDGYKLETAIDGYGCLGSSYPHVYQGESTEPKLWRALTDHFVQLTGQCPRLDDALRRTYLAELNAAQPDFITAIAEMKERAAAVFGGWRRRCAKFSSNRPSNPFWSPECMRYSAKAN